MNMQPRPRPDFPCRASAKNVPGTFSGFWTPKPHGVGEVEVRFEQLDSDKRLSCVGEPLEITVPNGQAIAGAYNRQLTNLNGGYSSSHSDVHLWYHGTIDLVTPATDTQASITTAERQTWWTAFEAAGTNTGFLYSLIGGGDRLSSAEPGGAGKGQRRYCRLGYVFRSVLRELCVRSYRGFR